MRVYIKVDADPKNIYILFLKKKNVSRFKTLGFHRIVLRNSKVLNIWN